MKPMMETLHVNYAEYSYFKQLKKQERLNFFFDLYDAHMARHSGIDITSFITQLREQVIESKTNEIKQQLEQRDADQVDVMIDDDNIMIESNSLRATRHIIYKFFESGYILQRDKDMENAFKRDKVTRYLRVFRIIDQVSTLCLN